MTPTKNEISKKISLVKENFTKQKKKIELDFYKTKKGTKNCKKISEITDKLIEGIFTLTPETREIKSNLLILAVGGYGRKQLAPYSDIDLLFAHNQVLKREKLKRIIEFILYPLWDLGLKVGYSVRNFKEIISFSKKDHTIKTRGTKQRKI